MCWNEHVSLNTFSFSVFVLLLIYYNNSSSSKYKITELENPYMYLFIMSFVTMQFIEFILWRHLKIKSVNQLFSIIGVLLLTLQPIASILLVEDQTLRTRLLLTYGIPALGYIIYLLMTKKFQTTVSPAGHLRWNWAFPDYFILMIAYYMFFLYLPLLINRNYFALLFTLSLFVVTYYFYYRDGSAGSLWCWSINAIMIFLLAKLLFYLPLQEKQGLC